ncbi:hypothetical protein HDV02_005912 [Globomyces sp. JEL0801]|nr:hypothetical protein HDV02_005912 [Globomyces sp. JEL0801]
MYGTSIGLSLMTKAVFYAFGQIIALVADLLLIYLLFSLAVALKSPTIVSTFWKRGLNAIRALSFLAGIAGVGWKISSSKAGNYIIILAIASIQLVFIHQLQPNATKKVGMYLQLFFKQSRLVITVIVLTIAQIGHGFPPFSEIPDIVQFFGNNLTIGLRAVICLHFLLKLENEKKSTVSNHKTAHANEMLCKPSMTAK